MRGDSSNEFRVQQELEIVALQLEPPFDPTTGYLGVVKVSKDEESSIWIIHRAEKAQSGVFYLEIFPFVGWPGLIYVNGNTNVKVCFSRFGATGPQGIPGPRGIRGIRGGLSDLEFDYKLLSTNFEELVPPSNVDEKDLEGGALLDDGQLQFQSIESISTLGEQWIKMDPEDIHGVSIRSLIADIHSNISSLILGAIGLEFSPEVGEVTSIQFHILQIIVTNSSELIWFRVALWKKDDNFRLPSFPQSGLASVKLSLTRATRKGDFGIEPELKNSLELLLNRYRSLGL